MPELRQDPILGHWVIVSEQRGQRPAPAASEAPATAEADCDFCPGSESQTLPELSCLREPGTAPNSPGWRVRVVPNKYPALHMDEAQDSEQPGLFSRRAGRGHHEVIIEGAAHTHSVTEFESIQMKELVAVYRDRFRAVAQIPGMRSAMLIKNVGEAAGMSIAHSHSQLIATPVLSPVLEAELRSARDFSTSHDGACIWCEIIRAERERGERVVAVRSTLLALCPWASRFPFETWIVPVEHESHFGLATDVCLGEFAELILDVLRAIERCLANPPYNLAHNLAYNLPYNYAIHTAPFPVEPESGYHWRLAIMPRVTRAAGYEQASGVYINHVLPEDAAKRLRQQMRR